MLFPTFDFLLFAIPALALSWALATRVWARTLLLLGASYFFYMAGPKTEPPPAPWYYAGLLLFSTVLDFACARRIHALAARLDDPARAASARRERNLWLVASLVGNLGLLGYFKYVNFFIQAFSDIAGAFDLPVQAFRFDVILPLGISFYTFQSLSYTIDVWRRRLTPERSFARFALFVVFFPQLVAGPIVRATELLPQLARGPRFSRARLEEGAFRVVRGLAKKVVLGDWIAVQLTDPIFDAPGTYTSLELLLALYAYTLQIYADFAGYSDIAIGMGRLLGYDLPENFDRPYQARDIGEFWRRWHQTLSGWLRDYLYFPLRSAFGANSGYPALWLTMFLVGMWHGASWNFVIYSNLHAGAMLFNRWNRRRDRTVLSRRLLVLPAAAAVGLAFGWLGGGVLHLDERATRTLAGGAALAFVAAAALPRAQTPMPRLVHVGHVLLTLHFVVLSRVFFRAPDLDTARNFVAGLLTFDGRGLRPGLVSPWVYLALALGMAYHFTPKRWVDDGLLRLFRRVPGPVLGAAFALFLLGLMKLMAGAPKAFIYFQF